MSQDFSNYPPNPKWKSWNSGEITMLDEPAPYKKGAPRLTVGQTLIMTVGKGDNRQVVELEVLSVKKSA